MIRRQLPRLCLLRYGLFAQPVVLAELMLADIHPRYAERLDVLEGLYRLGNPAVDLSGMAAVQDFLFVPRGRHPVAAG